MPSTTTRLKRLVPVRIRRAVRDRLDRGTVALGDLRRTTPIGVGWGFRRGLPIDRVYIEAFLEECRPDIRGRVLEVGGSKYTRRYGSSVTRADVLDIDPGNAHATVVGDLTSLPDLPDASYDCIILTQVLQYLPDVLTALRTVERLLSSGGVLLATVPGITKVSASEDARFGDWWRFTSRSAGHLVGEAFGSEDITVRSFGNVQTAAAFLYGLAREDLEPRVFTVHDPLFEVVIAVRAVKVA